MKKTRQAVKLVSATSRVTGTWDLMLMSYVVEALMAMGLAAKGLVPLDR